MPSSKPLAPCFGEGGAAAAAAGPMMTPACLKLLLGRGWSPGLKEEGSDLLWPFRIPGELCGALLTLVDLLHVGPLLHQRLDEVERCLGSRVQQSRLVVLVLGVDVCTVFQQQFRQLQMSVRHRKHEGRDSTRLLHINLSLGLDESLDQLLTALLRCSMRNRCPSVGLLAQVLGAVA